MKICAFCSSKKNLEQFGTIYMCDKCKGFSLLISESIRKTVYEEAYKACSNVMADIIRLSQAKATPGTH